MSKAKHRPTDRGRPAGRPGWLSGVLGLAVVLAATLGAAGSSAVQPRLTSVSAVTDGGAVTIVIEASEPVPYVTAQPDPLTVVIDLRNVNAAGVRATIGKPVGPVADVAVEDARAEDGVALARIRLSLSRPSKPVVRSRRGAILVEFGVSGSNGSTMVPAAAAPAQVPTPKPAAAKAPQPVTNEPLTLKKVDITHSTFGTRVTLSANGPLPAETPVPLTVLEPTGGDPPRLVLDFRGVTAGAQTITGPGDGPVERVRVAQNSRQPLVARVVIDLRKRTAYRLENAGGQLSVVLEPEAVQPAGVAADAGRPAQASTAGTAPAAPAAQPPVAPTPAPATVTPPAGKSTEPAVQSAAPVKNQNLPSSAPSPVVVKAAKEPAKPPAEQVKPVPEPVKPVPEPVKPVPEPVKPAPEPVKPAPEPVKPAPEPVKPVPEPVKPVPEPVKPAPEPVKPAPVQPEQSAAQDMSGRQQKTYTGHPVTFDFQGADLRSVLRTFSDISGLNVVIDPSITGSVDVSLREVPWDQALDIILRANKLGYSIDNNVVRIATLKALSEEEEERQKLVETQAKGGQLKVLTRSLSYAKATDLARLLKDARVISDRGTAFVDERSNTLIINDLPEALADSEALIATLDRAEPQVEIEARIVQTTRENARALGVQWGASGRMASELGNTSPLQFPAQGSISGRTTATQGNPIGPVRSAVPTGVNMPVTGATSAIGIAMGTLNGSFNLDVALSALEKKGHGRILSTPRVVMQNNVEAEMYQGIQIPIQTVSNNTVTVTFKDAALSLKVRPQITASNTVILDINLENASPDYSREVNGIPPIDTQRAKTQVLVNDAETTVIGGIYVQRETSATDSVPMLHRIPLLGWLFKRDSLSDDNRELLIFITPKIRR